MCVCKACASSCTLKKAVLGLPGFCLDPLSGQEEGQGLSITRALLGAPILKPGGCREKLPTDKQMAKIKPSWFLRFVGLENQQGILLLPRAHPRVGHGMREGILPSAPLR